MKGVKAGLALLVGCTFSMACLTGCTAVASGTVSPSVGAHSLSVFNDSSSTDLVSASVVPGTASHTDGVSYRDGTYYARGMGKFGEVPVTVVIQDGAITRVTVGSNQESEPQIEKAQNTVIPAIISTQSTDVETASGATNSCEAIISAVNDVLERAAL